MKDSSVKGVLCADENGDSLYHRGTLNSNSAAVSAQLTALSANLEPNSQPIIILNSSSSKVILTNNGPITTAVHKQL